MFLRKKLSDILHEGCEGWRNQRRSLGEGLGEWWSFHWRCEKTKEGQDLGINQELNGEVGDAS